jgi:hypothetical protein
LTNALGSAPWADLVRSLAVLRPRDEETLRALAALFGIEAPASAAAIAGSSGSPRTAAVAEGDRAEKGDAVHRRRAAAPAPAAAVPAPRAGDAPSGSAMSRGEIAAMLTPDRTARHAPAWLETVVLLPEPHSFAEPPLPDPLLEPRWTRAILGGALATPFHDGPLDAQRLVSEAARGVPLCAIPRRVRPTLARGVQVLVDRGERMQPWSADQRQLVEQVRSVAGREQVEVLYFAGLPAWGAGPGSRLRWRGYHEHHAPRPGTVVVLLTDLGLGPFLAGSRSPGPAQWRHFALRAARAGSPLLVFVPYGEERWPAELRGCLHLLHWDRATTAQSVRRSIGRALSLPGRGAV